MFLSFNDVNYWRVVEWRKHLLSEVGVAKHECHIAKIIM